MAQSVNHYQVLGVDRTATEEQLRKRFRELARERHPDRFPPAEKARAEAEFQSLTEAYNILTNRERRAAHDFDLDNKVVSADDPQAIAQAYLARGVDEYREGRWDSAFSNFELAMHHDPENAKIQHHFALAASRFPNRMRHAVAAIEKSIRIDPHNASFLKDAGLIFRQAGLWSRAEKCYLEAMRWTPDSAEVRRGLEEARAHRAPQA
ncbi:MAG TPA: DnaJ domain-containing protein [Thermoanaerobaculia bacterium]|jgi:DnaJ-class molecular chaperone|nr:DnaJ domain-containing protein [Thermoanaerobaculia bacterium]